LAWHVPEKALLKTFLTLVSKALWPVGVVLAAVSLIVLNQVVQGGHVQAVSTADMS